MPTLTHPDPPLTGDGFALRPWADTDLERAFEALQDPSIPRFTHVPEDQTAAELRVFVHGLDQARASGQELAFVIADAATDDVLGSISLLRIDWDAARAEIGYWVAPWARRRGIAAGATRLLTDWVLATLPLVRVELRIDADNAGSLGVARRAGFTHEGTLRSFEVRKGRRMDVAVWSRLAAD